MIPVWVPAVCFAAVLVTCLAVRRKLLPGMWRVRLWRSRHAPVPQSGKPLSEDEAREWQTVLRGWHDDDGTAGLAWAERAIEQELKTGETS